MPKGWLSARDIAPMVGHSPRWVIRHMGQLATKFGKRDYRWRITVINMWLILHGLEAVAE